MRFYKDGDGNFYVSIPNGRGVTISSVIFTGGEEFDSSEEENGLLVLKKETQLVKIPISQVFEEVLNGTKF